MDVILLTHVLLSLFRLWRTVTGLLYWNIASYIAIWTPSAWMLFILTCKRFIEFHMHARLISKVRSYGVNGINYYNGLKMFYPTEDSEKYLVE